MRENRFIGDYDFSSASLVVADAGLANQLANVLRLGVGGEVVLSDGRGREADATIVSLAPGAVGFALTEVRDCVNEPFVAVTLYCAVLKGEHFELVAQKAVECGVSRIVPVISTRTVKLGVRPDRLVKIIREAAEQSGRGVLPTLVEPMKYADAVAEAVSLDASIIFELGEPLFNQALLIASQAKTVGVFIGPEGGWTPEEVAAAKSAGVQSAGLGKRTLRAETAAVVATFLTATAGE